jgi:superfamily I DNA/RNA helicase
LPIHLKLRFPKFREVFTDESQDFSKLMWAIAEKCVSARGRLIVVGDSSQSIYSFTGASPEIFLNKISEKNTKLLPLPVSYRCSRAVCEEARKFCDNQIIPHESNKEGNVGEANFEYAEWGDFVLCRTNKPLMAAYYTLLAQGTKCYIKDKDLGDALIKEISPFLKYKTMDQYRSDAEKSINMLVSKLLQKGVERPHRTIKYKELKEKKDLIIYLGGINQDSPRKLYDSLREMFSDKKDRGVALMTIHKSKGLEAGTVFLICPDLIPSKYASTPEMIQQEKNLMFVAVTRAINNFFYDRSFTSKDI